MGQASVAARRRVHEASRGGGGGGCAAHQSACFLVHNSSESTTERSSIVSTSRKRATALELPKALLACFGRRLVGLALSRPSARSNVSTQDITMQFQKVSYTLYVASKKCLIESVEDIFVPGDLKLSDVDYYP